MSNARSNGIMGSLRSANSGFVNLGRPQTTTGFSIHDAFEEEEDTDEVIKVYGNGASMAMNGGQKSKGEEGVKIRMESSDSNRYEVHYCCPSTGPIHD